MADSIVAALEHLRASGRRVIVVTGRQLEDLGLVSGGLDHFDYVVAENGALIYESRTREITLLAEPPPKQFVSALRSRGVHPLAVGRVILATQSPYETKVEQAIREFKLDLQIILNKGAVDCIAIFYETFWDIPISKRSKLWRRVLPSAPRPSQSQTSL